MNKYLIFSFRASLFHKDWIWIDNRAVTSYFDRSVEFRIKFAFLFFILNLSLLSLFDLLKWTTGALCLWYHPVPDLQVQLLFLVFYSLSEMGGVLLYLGCLKITKWLNFGGAILLKLKIWLGLQYFVWPKWMLNLRVQACNRVLVFR